MSRKQAVPYSLGLLVLSFTVLLAWAGTGLLLLGSGPEPQKKGRTPPHVAAPVYLPFTGTEFHFRFWYPAQGWEVSAASANVLAQITNRAGSSFVVLHTALDFPLTLDEMGHDFIDVENDVLKKDFPSAQVHSADFITFHKSKAVEIRYDYTSEVGPQAAREVIIIHGKDLFRLRTTALKSSSAAVEPLLSWMMENFYFYDTLASAPAAPTPMPAAAAAAPPVAAGAVHPRPTPSTPRPTAPVVPPPPTTSVPPPGESTGSLYQQARAEYLKFSFASAGRAVQLFQRALSADRTFAPFFAGQAEALGWRVVLARAHSFLTETGEAQAAMDLAEQAAKLSRDLVPVQRALALAYYLNGRTKDSDRALKRADQINPADAETHLIIAITHLDEPEQLLTDSQAALGLNPTLIGALYLQGLALVKLQRQAEALESFGKVVSLSPEFTEAYFERGEILAQIGQENEAIASFQKAIALNPKMVSARFKLAILQQQTKHIDEAIQQYQAIIQASPALPQPYYNLGALYADEKKDNAQATAYFRKFLELTKDEAKAEQVQMWLQLHPR
ncbi:MAG: tetratricopeptide repeat protein [Acidobacteriia bacterium]|nr:tetratricopeptide repeat protein [Terriglobia bacterium]